MGRTAKGGKEKVLNRTLKSGKDEQEERPQRGRGRGAEENSIAFLPENMKVCTNKHVPRETFEGRSTGVKSARKGRRGRKAIVRAQESKKLRNSCRYGRAQEKTVGFVFLSRTARAKGRKLGEHAEAATCRKRVGNEAKESITHREREGREVASTKELGPPR